MDFYQFLNKENVRINSITPSQKEFLKENIESILGGILSSG